VVLERLDPVVVALIALGVRTFLLDDPREPLPVREAHAGGRRERRARYQRPQLDELMGRDCDGAKRRARPDGLHVSANPHRLAPGALDLPRGGLHCHEPVERLAH
jgi:hypothetical protein